MGSNILDFRDGMPQGMALGCVRKAYVVVPGRFFHLPFKLDFPGENFERVAKSRCR